METLDATDDLRERLVRVVAQEDAMLCSVGLKAGDLLRDPECGVWAKHTFRDASPMRIRGGRHAHGRAGERSLTRRLAGSDLLDQWTRAFLLPDVIALREQLYPER